MSFPVYISLGPLHLHPHFILELLGYSLGFQWFRYLSRRSPLRQEPLEKQLWLLIACIFGAIIGARGLAWIETPFVFEEGVRHWIPPGKTIVGGLIGGWFGMEWAKRRLGYQGSSGDYYVYPLTLGMILGRLGCFLTGLDDHTFGVYTSLPWGVDFGDGLRHPTQLYEALFLVLMGLAFFFFRKSNWPLGVRFRLFLMGYMLFRFSVEFIKPTLKMYLGLSAIQWAALICAGICLYSMQKLLKAPVET